MPVMVSCWNSVIKARAPVHICRSPARLGDELPNRTVTGLMSCLTSWYRLHELRPKEGRDIRPYSDEGKYHFSAVCGFFAFSWDRLPYNHGFIWKSSIPGAWLNMGHSKTLSVLPANEAGLPQVWLGPSTPECCPTNRSISTYAHM